MNKKLIMKACSLSIDLNSMDKNYVASVQISKYSTWLYVMDAENSCRYIFNKHDASVEDLNEFIDLLNKLMDEENEH